MQTCNLNIFSTSHQLFYIDSLLSFGYAWSKVILYSWKRRRRYISLDVDLCLYIVSPTVLDGFWSQQERVLTKLSCRLGCSTTNGSSGCSKSSSRRNHLWIFTTAVAGNSFPKAYEFSILFFIILIFDFLIFIYNNLCYVVM